jgi:hypothetical protein
LAKKKCPNSCTMTSGAKMMRKPITESTGISLGVQWGTSRA